MKKEILFKILFLTVIVNFILSIQVFSSENFVEQNTIDTRNTVSSLNQTVENTVSETTTTVESSATVLSRTIGKAIAAAEYIFLALAAFFLIRMFVKKDSNKILLILGMLVSGGLAFVCDVLTNFAVKPIIYIYPEKEENVEIKVSNPKKLTCTYPKYEDGWKVLAKPNGDLTCLKTNRNLYALYWEGINTTKPKFDEGFIVEGENVANFLEEKLEILGLNEREAEEFIVYWLPLMEKNKYNFIRFETQDEIKENMDLEITPTPDTLIRINMEFKPLSRPLKIKEQELIKKERKGYTVVEWGGTKV